MNNYSETVDLAKRVVKVADEELERGMPAPTCGMTCYKLAVALLHADYVSRASALREREKPEWIAEWN